MRSLVIALCGVLTAGAAIAAQQRDVRPTAKPAATAPAGKGTDVTVVVVSDDPSARPLRRVSVSLQLGMLAAPRTVVTDDAGRAVFSAVAPGNYLLIAFKPGYVRTFYGSKTPGRGPGVAVAVLEGKPVPELRLRVPRGAVISGTVRSVTGRPAANQMVQVMSPNALRNMTLDTISESTANAAMTDDRGIYRVYGLAPGSYLVSVSSTGMREEFRQVTAEQLQWASALSASGTLPAAAEPPPPPAPSAPASFSTVFYPGTTLATDAQPVTVEAGQERLGVDFAIMLVPTAQVRGRLVDEAGRPQANQNVSLRAPSTSAMAVELIESIGTGSTTTGADGTFTLTSVKPGRYTLSARATIRPPNEAGGTAQNNPMGEALAMLGLGGGTHWASEEITVAGTDITDLTLILKPTLTITGKVVIEASTLKAPEDMSSVRLAVNSVTTEPTSAVTTLMQSMFGGSSVTVASDGTFLAKGLSPGQYRITTQGGVLSALAPTERVDPWTLKSVMSGGRDVADTGIEVNQNVSNVTVTFTDRPSELAGTVFDQAGRVTPEFPIVVFSTDKTYWLSGSRRVKQARPASDGTFKVVGLPEGEYFVCAVTAVEQSELADPAFLEQLAASGYKIKIAIRAGEKTVQDLKLGGG